MNKIKINYITKTDFCIVDILHDSVEKERLHTEKDPLYITIPLPVQR
jgi:hypothetical protein